MGVKAAAAGLLLIAGVAAVPKVRHSVDVRTLPFIDLFRRIAGPRWVDRHSQARAESNLNPRARAVDGGMGLGQFMPGTWRQWGKGRDPFEPEANADAQHRYMNYLEARVDGDYHPALGAYNAGLGSVRKAQFLADELDLDGEDAWLLTLERVTGINKYTGRPNAEITRAYVRRNDRFRAEMHAAFREAP
jgi:membrane-bound lytic murein transglycosylase MltF